MPPAKPQPESAEALREKVRALPFEESIRQLEAIIDRIESGEVGLEDSLTEYERGILLRDHCREILARTEQRVSELKPPDQAGR